MSRHNSSAWPLTGLLSAVLLLGLGTAQLTGDDDLSKLRYPLSRSESLRTPNFVLDLSEVPDDEKVKAWANESKLLCEEWFPVICRFLATEKWTPPETVRLTFKKDLEAPGVTSGDSIQISVKWIKDHPDDFGMVIHELTHVVQNYPGTRQSPGWLIEGIADYVRYWKYEPEIPRPRLDPARAHYQQGYGTTAAFLAWMVRKYDRRIVLKLDEALRTATYHPGLFKDYTGKELDDLWREFTESLPKQ